MEGFKVGQLTKELVAARLKEMVDPCAAAAELVKKTLSAALPGIAATEVAGGKVVEDACLGAMTALLLAEQNLPKGAVLILQAVLEMSQALHYDQTAMMQCALRGMAQMEKYLPPGQLEDIRYNIEFHFMGAGAVFESLLTQKDEKNLWKP